jgi:membrane protease subunit HflC
MNRWMALGVALASLAVFGSFCVVILDEREQGFRTLLGSPDPLGAVLTTPGPKLRIPGLHEIDIYEKRLQRYDSNPREVQLSDGKLMEVDYFVVYRIADPQVFRQQMRNEDRLLGFLDDNSFGPVRDVLAQYPLDALLSEQRVEIMDEIGAKMAASLKPLGVDVSDVLLRGTDYPEENLPQTYARMIKERERFARKFRAEGDEEARKVRSKADLESQVLRAGATRSATELRGEGDSEAARIYAEAYNRDPEFYAFTRSLEAYKLALDDQTTVILSPNVPFLRHLFENGKPTR